MTCSHNMLGPNTMCIMCHFSFTLHLHSKSSPPTCSPLPPPQREEEQQALEREKADLANREREVLAQREDAERQARKKVRNVTEETQREDGWRRTSQSSIAHLTSPGSACSVHLLDLPGDRAPFSLLSFKMSSECFHSAVQQNEDTQNRNRNRTSI